MRSTRSEHFGKDLDERQARSIPPKVIDPGPCCYDSEALALSNHRDNKRRPFAFLFRSCHTIA